MRINNEIKRIINSKIRSLEKEYQLARGLILTEDDLKCLIFKKLSEIREYKRPVVTKDKVEKASYIHTEIPWYGEENRLTVIPDITIIDPKNLFIRRNRIRLPSKQFRFIGNAIVLELKYIRYGRGITSRVLGNHIKKDFDKIEKLNRINKGYKLFCFLVIFNRTNRVCREFRGFKRLIMTKNNYKLIYATGNMLNT